MATNLFSTPNDTDIIKYLRSDSGFKRNLGLDAYNKLGKDAFTQQLLGSVGMTAEQLSPEMQRQLAVLTGKLDAGKTGSFRGNLSAFESLAPIASTQYAAAQEQQAKLAPYETAGLGALDMQQALLGLKGKDAMMSAYNENPAQQFMREEMEKSLIRNRAVTGGLGDEGVSEALTRLNAGLTNQNIQGNLNQLALLTGRGQQASTNQAQFIGNRAQNEAAATADALGIRTAEDQMRTARNAADSGWNDAMRGISMASSALGLGTDIANFIPQIQQLLPQKGVATGYSPVGNTTATMNYSY